MGKTKKARAPLTKRDRHVRHVVAGDQVLEIESTVTAYRREIDWQEVRATARVEQDQYSGPPWEDDDGFEHRVVDADSVEGYNEDHTFWAGHTRKLVVVDREVARGWGSAYHGASKQVEAEAKAAELARSYALLVKWRKGEWYVYGVVVDFLDETESLWGIYTEDECFEVGDDKYLAEVADEMAGQACDALEKKGFVILGRPDRRGRYADNRRWHQKATRARAMGFESPEAYQAWLSGGPIPV